jgi:hypothetical protein
MGCSTMWHSKSGFHACLNLSVCIQYLPPNYVYTIAIMCKKWKNGVINILPLLYYLSTNAAPAAITHEASLP